jgi:hypothetical protein
MQRILGIRIITIPIEDYNILLIVITNERNYIRMVERKKLSNTFLFEIAFHIIFYNNHLSNLQ